MAAAGTRERSGGGARSGSEKDESANLLDLDLSSDGGVMPAILNPIPLAAAALSLLADAENDGWRKMRRVI